MSYLMVNTKNSNDPELKENIFNYLSRLGVIKQEKLKQLKD